MKPIQTDRDNPTGKLDQKQLDRLNKTGFDIQIVAPKSAPCEIVIHSLQPGTLSRNMPVLTHMGFTIDSENAYTLQDDSQTVYVRRYQVECRDPERFSKSQEHIAKMIAHVLTGKLGNTPVNALAFLAGLPPRAIRVIRAIATYENQLIPHFNPTVIQETLVRHPAIALEFFHYFALRFDPMAKNRESALETTKTAIEDAIKQVQNLTEDRVLSTFFEILKAMVRTNFYLLQEQGGTFYDKGLAFKFDVSKLSSLTKGVQPKIETFVFHKSFQGVHHRRTPVSRGGLRWSDRFEDYRSEVRGLMQAQRVKNAIIVPSGAKGGFVITEEGPVSKERFKALYTLFIEALLDMVDNRVDAQIVRPESIVAYDGEDAYFVVAADKGTAAMSDTANAISAARNFWLGDAFASGGSKGYSHKAMGITAKGAIKSVERFFIEAKKNFYEERISVVGIGSPAGDVFGNGIQLSPNFALVAAIGSREIFIDPNPDLAQARAERQRLFDEGKGWNDYNRKLISAGGGIWRKTDKTIELSEEAKALLGIKKTVVDGEELARAVLCAKVDLLFNGGVGTYVRASDENNAEIGDKPNEAVRVSALEIRAYAVCEGGNLGFTQKARLEYAKKGGHINTDHIDNSAGVQTSDYEVNLKILFSALTQKGILNENDRLEAMQSVAPTVEKSVLWTNYLQSLALSLDEQRFLRDLSPLRRAVAVLETQVDSFNKEELGYPATEDISAALTKKKTVPKPLLAMLLSYAKIFLKSRLLKNPEFIDSEQALTYLFRYFPKTFDTLYKNDLIRHPLRREIVATFIANKIINAQGIGFIADFDRLGEAGFLLKIRAFLAVNTLISANDIRFSIFRADYLLPVKKQYDLLLKLEESLAFLAEQIVEKGEFATAIFDHLVEYETALGQFIGTIDAAEITEILPGEEALNRFFSLADSIQMVLHIIHVKESTHQDFQEVARLFYTAAKNLRLFWLIDRLKQVRAENPWEERLQKELEKELFETVFRITKAVMGFRRPNESIAQAYEAFTAGNQARYNAYLADLKALQESDTNNLTGLAVVTRSLGRIAG